MNPIKGNPLQSREDAQRAIVEMFEPLVPAYRAGGARVSLGTTATYYDIATAELEAFARPLWGLAPLAAGGGEFAHWDLFREGLAHGTDPRDPQYWGSIGQTHGLPAEMDQRYVEMAPIGLALALVPEHIFDPLSAAERQHVLTWLEPINHHPLPANNWQFFRVMVNLGFARVGGPFDRAAVDESLGKIDQYWLGEGWYQDGKLGNTDFYNPWAYHFCGLIYAVLAAGTDPRRCTQFRERARRFATDFEAWFDSSGRVVPYGRSLTYRFDAASFWGALAFADEAALPWGEVRGLWAQNLRWWATQPIWRADGVLSIGWSYPDLLMSETYNGPGSPYWAFKYFLPLAVAADHPFWSTPEQVAGREARHSVQRPPIVVVNRDDRQAQVLNGGRGDWFERQGSAKSGKFAYSSAFAFGLDADTPMYQGVGDSMLVLRDTADVYQVRSHVSDSGIIEGDLLWARWQPYPDVEIVTVLCGEMPWHARLHHIQTGRELETFEGGFAIGSDNDPTGPPTVSETTNSVARVRTAAATSLIVDASRSRQTAVRPLQPNTDILHPRAVVPGLLKSLDKGTHVLSCVVAAVEAPWDLTADELPPIPERARRALESLVGEDSHPGKS